MHEMVNRVDCNDNKDYEAASDIVERKYKDGGWGWVVVAAAFVVGLVRFGTERSYPMFYLSIMHEYQINFAQVSQLIGSFFICFGVSGAFAPALIKKLGCQKCMILFGSIASASCFAAAMPGPYWKLLLCYGAIPGLCFGIGMVVALASVSEYFDKRQNLAIQLVLLSTSAGAFAANPTCGAFIQHYSWRGALLIISAIFLHLLPAGATMRPVHHLQIKHEPGSHFKSTLSPGTCTRTFQTAARYFDLRIFSMPTFYLSMLYISFHCIGLYSSLSFLVPYSVKELGTSNSRAAFLASAVAVGEVASKLLCGFFFYKVPQLKQKLFVCCLFLIAACLFATLPLIKSYNYVLCICVAIGLAIGSADGLYSLFYMQDFSKEMFPSLFGYTNVIAYCSCTAAALLIGHVVDMTNDLSNAFYVGAVSYTLASVILYLIHKITVSRDVLTYK